MIICMSAVVQATQTTPIGVYELYTRQLRYKSLRIYTWTVLCIMGVNTLGGGLTRSISILMKPSCADVVLTKYKFPNKTGKVHAKA